VAEVTHSANAQVKPRPRHSVAHPNKQLPGGVDVGLNRWLDLAATNKRIYDKWP